MISPVNEKLLCKNRESEFYQKKLCDCAACGLSKTGDCVSDPCKGCINPVTDCRSVPKVKKVA